MSSYLELVNKVIQESGKEQDELTLANWSSAEAGRKLYPRIKRLVKEAWRTIQMSRNEWEFNTAELTTVVYPRLKYAGGSASAEPSFASQWRGRESGTLINVMLVENREGVWLDGDATGQIEFTVQAGDDIKSGEIFDEVTAVDPGFFQFVEKGSYNFLNVNSEVREPQWSTFVAGKDRNYPTPVYYVPWSNHMYRSYSYMKGSNTLPQYVSQDFEGRLVFYPQPMEPFTISFVYDVAPQELILPTDVPAILPPEYHEWIAWLALMRLARFDKDPDLFAYANEMVTSYRNRAERNLMPLISWRDSNFNYRS